MPSGFVPQQQSAFSVPAFKRGEALFRFSAPSQMLHPSFWQLANSQPGQRKVAALRHAVYARGAP